VRSPLKYRSFSLPSFLFFFSFFFKKKKGSKKIVIFHKTEETESFNPIPQTPHHTTLTDDHQISIQLLELNASHSLFHISYLPPCRVRDSSKATLGMWSWKFLVAFPYIKQYMGKPQGISSSTYQV
jgi:hypothetical protein